MKIKATAIDGLVIIEPSVFEDDRGYFFESFNKKRFTELTGFTGEFVQDNQSLSNKNILRGLHLQVPPFAQAKLVRVTQGAVLDVAVDLRTGSSSYGKYETVELNEKNKLMLFIPEGFAHGFVSLEDNTLFLYKCSNYYHKESERTIIWDDAELCIDWKCDQPLISPKDEAGMRFNEFKSPF